MAAGVCGLALVVAAVGSIHAAPDKRAPPERDLIELGRRLFFDPEVSRSGARSCASCHSPEHGYSDPEPTSADDIGRTARHSQTLIDCAHDSSAHWDGEFKSVDDLVRTRLGLAGSRGYYRRRPLDEIDAFEQPTQTLRADAVLTLLTQRRYFTALKPFGKKKKGVRREAAAKAIAAYCKTIQSSEAPFDRHLAGDGKAISVAAKRGLDLFTGRAGCASCHHVRGDRPRFTDYDFHNTGLAWWAGAYEAEMDPGRKRFRSEVGYERAFKTPTLRDVTRRSRYMHDGRFRTLEEVVRYYAKGCGGDPKKDPRLRPFKATDEDVADLVAFLATLTSDVRPGVAKHVWAQRAQKTRLRFTASGGTPLGGLRVRFVPTGDRLPVTDATTEPFERTTNGEGFLDFYPTAYTHVRIELASNVDPIGGTYVPDTCRSALIRLPVSARAGIRVRFPREAAIPEKLVLDHFVEIPLPGHPRLRTHFPRVRVEPDGEEHVALYEGWIRTDVESRVEVQGLGVAAPRFTLLAGATFDVDLRKTKR